MSALALFARRPPLGAEAAGFAGIISNKLAQLDICYRQKKSEKDFALSKVVHRVKFSRAWASEEAIWLQIDTMPGSMPRGVSIDQIVADSVLTDLSSACERQIVYKKRGERHFLIVAREEGVFQIRKIDFATMNENYPTKSQRALMIPLGLTHNRKLVFESLDEFPHALVGGATGAGKTTLLHGWICALAQHNTPEQCRLLLIDLKGGTEFTRYQPLPHLWYYKEGEELRSGFIKDFEHTIESMQALRTELDRRLALFESHGGVQNIGIWNATHAPKLYHVVMFVDELAAIMLEPPLRKICEPILADIGMRGRSPGIHLVLATQRPEVSVVSGRIKANLDGRFGFRVPDMTSSMVILDDVSASQFPQDTSVGRYIYKRGNTRREIQTPWISVSDIDTMVESLQSPVKTAEEAAQEMEIEEAAIAKTKDVAVSAIAAEIEKENRDAELATEIYRLVITKFDGNFSARKLFDCYGKQRKIPIRFIQKLRNVQSVTVDGIMYEIVAPDYAYVPYRLVPACNMRAVCSVQDGATTHRSTIGSEVAYG
jgi:hypothetical protein